jgi:hypothetical protein
LLQDLRSRVKGVYLWLIKRSFNEPPCLLFSSLTPALSKDYRLYTTLAIVHPSKGEAVKKCANPPVQRRFAKRRNGFPPCNGASQNGEMVFHRCNGASQNLRSSSYIYVAFPLSFGATVYTQLSPLYGFQPLGKSQIFFEASFKKLCINGSFKGEGEGAAR